ncbi:hypothetical protein EJB05_24329 [Eragrostis curvula]|uniref:CRC domain-containing protein n=1 Tax=Eragrostis curvula TaxID=38414 RepID=A0A5J9V8L5_9POAL|nr:hypothetical protein EJB05_24329 [Eragrostis curvula]
MEQGRNQQQPNPAAPAVVGEMKEPAAAAQQQRPAAPGIPAARPWPVVFTPTKPATEVKSVTPKKKKHCNCRNSKCLKMYCECFAAQDNSGAIPLVPKHNKGCHCKKSGCLKKYCECYQANVLCSKNCRCMDCKNFEGSDERKASIQVEYASDRNHIKQGASIIHNSTTGTSGYNYSPMRRKRTYEDALGGKLNTEGVMSEAQFRQGNPADASLLPPSTGCDGHNATHSPSKSFNPSYRSPLANTIHLSEVKDLVKNLVTGCKTKEETYMAVAGTESLSFVPCFILDNKVDETGEGKELHTNDGLSNGHCNQQDSNEAQTLACNEPSVKDSRPASPATQALMCNEQDTTFGDDYRSSFPSISCDQDISEINVAQENLVFTGLRDYLRLIITRGKINEHKSSSEAAIELGAQLDHGATPSISPSKAEENDTSSNGTKTLRSNQQSISNDGSKGNNGS